MTDMQPIPPGSSFDSIRHEDEQGEYWTARELAKELGYTARDSWRNFERAIIEAKVAAASQGYDVTRLFVDIDKKSSGGRPAQDYHLTRFACYMIALSADGAKEQVAAAKVYFAIKTREQEIADLDQAYLDWRARTIRSFIAHGYSQEWSERRVDDITARNALTHEWVIRGIEQREIPILTDALHMGSFGISINEHKGVKEFEVTHKGKRIVYKGDLPPAMTATELALNSLASSVSRELHVTHDSHGFDAIEADVHEAGKFVGDTRMRLEELTGRPVVSPRNMVRDPDGGLWTQLPAPDDATVEKDQ